MSDEQLKVIMAYMPKDMENNAVNWFNEAFSTYTTHKDMADYLKQKFDHIYGRNWQCIIGKNFESSITHLDNNLIYFYGKGLEVLLFKTTY
uniref:Dynein light chain n=1 Tax=Schistosoma japonicum TaxID=6182 RepID=C1LEA7_SCHJA|nr:Dynein light chain, type 1,domain-containing protein [Schistosoma japonicum]